MYPLKRMIALSGLKRATFLVLPCGTAFSSPAWAGSDIENWLIQHRVCVAYATMTFNAGGIYSVTDKDGGVGTGTWMPTADNILYIRVRAHRHIWVATLGPDGTIYLSRYTGSTGVHNTVTLGRAC